MTEPKREADDYNRHYSHYHCWDQKQPSACGQDLKDHKQCCLCDTVAPKRESGCEDCGEITCSGSCGVPEICKSSQDPNEKCPSAKSSVGPCKFHQSHQESGWEAEFDSFFSVRKFKEGSSWNPPDVFTIKSFISQLLTSEREKGKRAVETAIGLARTAERRILGEKLKELRLSGPTWVGEHAKKLDNYSYNRALDDTLQALDQ